MPIATEVLLAPRRTSSARRDSAVRSFISSSSLCRLWRWIIDWSSTDGCISIELRAVDIGILLTKVVKNFIVGPVKTSKPPQGRALPTEVVDHGAALPPATKAGVAGRATGVRFRTAAPTATVPARPAATGALLPIRAATFSTLLRDRPTGRSSSGAGGATSASGHCLSGRGPVRPGRTTRPSDSRQRARRGSPLEHLDLRVRGGARAQRSAAGELETDCGGTVAAEQMPEPLRSRSRANERAPKPRYSRFPFVS